MHFRDRLQAVVVKQSFGFGVITIQEFDRRLQGTKLDFLCNQRIVFFHNGNDGICFWPKAIGQIIFGQFQSGLVTMFVTTLRNRPAQLMNGVVIIIQPPASPVIKFEDQPFATIARRSPHPGCGRQQPGTFRRDIKTIFGGNNHGLTVATTGDLYSFVHGRDHNPLHGWQHFKFRIPQGNLDAITPLRCGYNTQHIAHFRVINRNGRSDIIKRHNQTCTGLFIKLNRGAKFFNRLQNTLLQRDPPITGIIDSGIKPHTFGDGQAHNSRIGTVDLLNHPNNLGCFLTDGFKVKIGPNIKYGPQEPGT